MPLTGEQYEKLVEAFTKALPSKARLTHLLRFKLSKSLNDIVSDGSLKEIVFELIGVAEAEGWTESLVLAARKANPHNPELLRVVQELGFINANIEVAQNRVDFEENQDHSDVRNEENEEASHNSQPNFEQLPNIPIQPYKPSPKRIHLVVSTVAILLILIIVGYYFISKIITPKIEVIVSPNRVILQPGQEQEFTANVKGTKNKRV